MLRSLLERFRRAIAPGGTPATPAGRSSRLTTAALERIVWDVLQESQAIPLDRLIRRVADEAMRADQAAGGWVADIGVWGPAYYQQQALKTVVGMLGTSLALQGEEGLLAVPVHPPAPRARGGGKR